MYMYFKTLFQFPCCTQYTVQSTAVLTWSTAVWTNQCSVFKNWVTSCWSCVPSLTLRCFFSGQKLSPPLFPDCFFPLTPPFLPCLPRLPPSGRPHLCVNFITFFSPSLTLHWALFIHFIPFCLPSVVPPLWLHNLSSPHLDLLFPLFLCFCFFSCIYSSHSPPSTLTLYPSLSLSFSPPSFSPSLTPSPSPCLPSPPLCFLCQ